MALCDGLCIVCFVPPMISDVLSCAVAKNDVVSIGLLIDKYPDLMNRTHPLWSKPLLQVSCIQSLHYPENIWLVA